MKFGSGKVTLDFFVNFDRSKVDQSVTFKILKVLVANKE